jgi:hypothetical protein
MARITGFALYRSIIIYTLKVIIYISTRTIEMRFLAEAQVFFFSVVHIDNSRFLPFFYIVHNNQKAVLPGSFERCIWDTVCSFYTSAIGHIDSP